MKLTNNLAIETLMNMYYEEGFSNYQLQEIEEGLLNGLDVSVYAHLHFFPDQMKLIRKGLEKGYDVSTYATHDYSVWHMHQIFSGLERGLDVSAYAKTYLTASQMHALRDGLILGFDMKPYAKAKLDVLAIREEIERLMSESNFDFVRRQKYRNYVDNIYLPLKAKLELEF